jgi:hypothetical protein
VLSHSPYFLILSAFEAKHYLWGVSKPGKVNDAVTSEEQSGKGNCAPDAEKKNDHISNQLDEEPNLITDTVPENDRLPSTSIQEV